MGSRSTISIRLFILGIMMSVPALAKAEDATLIAVMNTSLRQLDPIATPAYVTRNHGYMIYDVLIAQDEAFRPRPQMADWQQTADGLLYTFRLREGLMLHDGQPVTAADVVASLKRWGQRDNGGQFLFEQTSRLRAAP